MSISEGTWEYHILYLFHTDLRSLFHYHEGRSVSIRLLYCNFQELAGVNSGCSLGGEKYDS